MLLIKTRAPVILELIMIQNIIRWISAGLNHYRFDQHIPSLLMAIFIGILGGYGAL